MFPAYPEMRGRTALVTGASSGIGRGVALALAAQGTRVVGQFRRQPVPQEVVAVQADLGTEDGCVEAVRTAASKVGPIHSLVHSAGIYESAPIESISASALETMFRVNVHSAFYLVRELLPRGLRNVVLIGSTAGQRGEPGHAHYAASKGAVQSMMMSLAVELAPTVRVNLVSPGWVRTPMAEPSLQRIGAALSATIPNRRVAEVADVANAVLWLLSDASSHCIGQDICVSGGALLVVPRGQVKPS